MKVLILGCVLMSTCFSAFAGLIDGEPENCLAPVGMEYQCSTLKGPIYLQPNGSVTFPFIHCNDADLGQIKNNALTVVLRGSIADTYLQIPMAAFSGVSLFKMPLEVPYSKVHRTSVCRRVK